MKELLQQPWPWYVGGPLIGLMVPFLLIVGNKQFGVSSSLKHFCASCLPVKADYFRYDLRDHFWNLLFVAGILIGGILGGMLFDNPRPVRINGQTKEALKGVGVKDFSELIPLDLFHWGVLLTWEGWVVLVMGGFMIGFGARYAGGCTSGHGITGLAQFSKGSLVAVIGFFIGGLIVTHFFLPWVI